jgi:hypothetical protein
VARPSASSSREWPLASGVTPSRTRAKRAFGRTPVAGGGLWLAPAKPVLRILDKADPLAKLAATTQWDANGSAFPALAGEVLWYELGRVYFGVRS